MKSVAPQGLAPSDLQKPTPILSYMSKSLVYMRTLKIVGMGGMLDLKNALIFIIQNHHPYAIIPQFETSHDQSTVKYICHAPWLIVIIFFYF